MCVCILIPTQLSRVDNAKEFQALLGSEDYEFRYACGVTKPCIRIPYSDKEKIIEAIGLHYSVLASLAELEQLRRGLTIQKFGSLMQSHPSTLHKAFRPPEIQITSDIIQDLFVPSFSPSGSNKRNTEEAIVMTWIRYLQHLEGMKGKMKQLIYMYDCTKFSLWCTCI